MIPEFVKDYYLGGLTFIPFSNGAKGGTIFPQGYARFRESQELADLTDLFSRPYDGVAMLCVDDIEAIDIDTKHDPSGNIAKDYFKVLKDNEQTKAILEKCVIQKTKSGGYHIIYKCKSREGNQKLAKRDGGKEAVIETRGKGGLLFVNPTPNYKIVKGSLFEIEYLKKSERDLLINFARAFNQEQELIPSKVKRGYNEGETPWDAFNEQHLAVDLIEGYGWTRVKKSGNFTLYARPENADSKWVSGSVHEEKNFFHCFTSSTAFEPGKNYLPFQVYAIMEHGGDFSKAASQLLKDGYGSQPKQKEVKEDQKQEVIKEKKEKRVNALIEKAEKTVFDYHAKLPEADVCLWHIEKRDGITKEWPMAGYGMMGCFVGHEKSGKSYLMGRMAGSHLSSGFDNFSWRLVMPGKTLLFVDTEQSEYFYKLTQKRIHFHGSMKGNNQNYKAIHLRSFMPSERMDVLEHYIYNTPNLGAVFIDGYVDLSANYNDLQESQSIVQKLMKWTDEKKILMNGVLHLNKGDGKIRGHLGTEIKNKAEFIVKSTKKERGEYYCSNPTGRFAEFAGFDWYRERDEDLPYKEAAWTEFGSDPRYSSSFPVTASKTNW